jgi:hypothetical protein
MTTLNQMTTAEREKFVLLQDQTWAVRTLGVNDLVTQSFNYIGVTYPDSNTVVYTYKLGGESGITVATITVVYSGGQLVSVTKV